LRRASCGHLVTLATERYKRGVASPDAARLASVQPSSAPSYNNEREIELLTRIGHAPSVLFNDGRLALAIFALVMLATILSSWRGFASPPRL
jgi:hypothetical protein